MSGNGLAITLISLHQFIFLYDHLSKDLTDTTFPTDLPVPIDDGACDHLLNATLPSVTLRATNGLPVHLSVLPTGLTIIFCYPRTGEPNEVIPDEWNYIPGARGCTPQACSFRDNFPALKDHGVSTVYGLSTQSTEYQKEVKERVHLPYELLSDEDLEFATSLKLPTFEWKGNTLIKRMALAIRDGRITKVWYPVFPPDQSAAQVLEWLKAGE